MASLAPMKILEDKPVIEIQGIKAIGGNVLSMTCTSEGLIVITGYVPEDYSHITTINIKGEVIRQVKIKRADGSIYRPYRRCDCLSQYEVATMCESGQIGLYDVRDGTYVKKDTWDVTSEVISGWSPDQYVSCVAADPVSRNIFVGTKSTSSAKLISRDMLIFDDKLNYLRTLVLPDMMRESRDVIVHGHNLVVCDHWSKNAYIVTMKDSEAKLVLKVKKPHHDGAEWIPYKVCTDSHGLIYMLWESWGLDDWGAVLTQHIQDGDQLLATIPVDGYADAICAFKTEEGEKLLVVAKNSAMMYKFSLLN